MHTARAITAALTTIAIVMAGALPFGPAAAEDGPKPRPYKPVAVALPQPQKDSSFTAFRKQLADIATRKDRAALAKHVAANFFWIADEGKDIADKKRSGVDNMVRAFYLDNPDTEGWDMLAAFAADATADPLPKRKGVICGPGEPKYDSAALTELGKATGTTASFWYYPVSDGLAVRAAAPADSKVTGRLGMHFVWVHPDLSPAAAVHTETVRIVLPSGQLGFVAADSIIPLPGDLLCYAKEGGTWKIAGFFGGLPPQN